MTYKEIQKTIETYPHYEFPIQADDEDGNKIIVTEGTSEVVINDEPTEVHYYQVYTYLPDGRTRMNLYYAHGVTTEFYV